MSLSLNKLKFDKENKKLRENSGDELDQKSFQHMFSFLQNSIENSNILTCPLLSFIALFFHYIVALFRCYIHSCFSKGCPYDLVI